MSDPCSVLILGNWETPGWVLLPAGQLSGNQLMFPLLAPARNLVPSDPWGSHRLSSPHRINARSA